MAKDGGRSWLKYGCLGCAGIAGLFLLVVAVMLALAWNQVGSEEFQERVFEPAIPGIVEPRPPGAATIEFEETGRPMRLPGHLIIDVSGGGEFHIEPAPAGEKLRVEASYDADQFELVESVESRGDDGWVYEVRFGGPGSTFFSMLRRLLGAGTPRVTVHIPVDVQLSLDLRVRDAGGVAELGGLWLTTADLSMEQGGMAVNIGEPLRDPMERMTVKGSMGGLSIEGLGNASPAVLEFEFSMGGMNADLRGDWRQDCEITFDASMGGGSLEIPRNVRLVGVAGHDDPPTDPDQPAVPTLTFTPESRLDDVQITRR